MRGDTIVRQLMSKIACEANYEDEERLTFKLGRMNDSGSGWHEIPVGLAFRVMKSQESSRGKGAVEE